MDSVRVLSVCTHNQTRSVLIGALLTEYLRQRRAPCAVRAAGFAEPGQCPTAPTVRLLADRGIDVSTHRSRRLEANDVAAADLIVTAERMHVVEIGGRWPEAFYKTMTLPEVVDRSASFDRREHLDVESWLRTMSADRSQQLDYLEATDIGEIADPTGQSPAAWRACLEQVDHLTRRLAEVLASGTMSPS